jgi:hypothetical protein
MKTKNSIFEVLLYGILHKIIKLDSKYTRFKHRNVKCEYCGVNSINHIAYLFPKCDQRYELFTGNSVTIHYENHYFCSRECSEYWMENHRDSAYQPVTEDKKDLIRILLEKSFKGVVKLVKMTT